jgi:hypothetical protein
LSGNQIIEGSDGLDDHETKQELKFGDFDKTGSVCLFKFLHVQQRFSFDYNHAMQKSTLHFHTALFMDDSKATSISNPFKWNTRKRSTALPANISPTAATVA